MIKPQYITRPAQRDPEPANVVNHDDIDWRTVQVAEAIDAERQHQLAQRATLEALKAKRKPGLIARLLRK